jgi:hypothetical protein
MIVFKDSKTTCKMNKQITEDYCNKDISVMLKEKGFDVPVKNYFSLNKDAMLHNLDKKYGAKKNWNAFEICISRPSQSLALKWLREVHNIVIEINMDDYMTTTDGKLKVTYSYTIWTFIQHLGETGLTDARYDDRAFWQENVKVGQSFEEACEAAIKYCLENLLS